MPDTGLLFLSLVNLIMGVSLILYPHAISTLSKVLNRTLAVWDHQLMRHRHILGVLACLASYAFFQLALLVPLLGR